MKKVMMMFAFVGALAFVGQAQSCCAGKKGTASTASCMAPSEAATKAAAADPSIEKRVCAETGTVCFVRKAVAQDGSVAFADVSFDATAGKFVNVSPAATCAKPAAAAATCAKPAAAATTCAKPGAACCAGKAAATSTTAAPAPANAPKVTPVKTKVAKVVKPVAATSSEK